MLASAFTSCSKEDNSVYPDGIVIRNGYSLDSIYAEALEKATGDEITIQLPAGVEVFMKGDIEINEGIKLNIIGDAAKPAKVSMKGGFITSNSIVIKNVKFTIDEAVAVPFIKMNTLPEEGLNEKNAFEIDGITLDGIEIIGLKNQLFYANKQLYLIKGLTVNKSTIAIEGASKKTIFDTNGGGFLSALTVTNSTIFADKATVWQNGGFFSSQSGKKPGEVSEDETLTQTFTLTGNTFYNITNGKTVSSLRENNKDYQFYVVKDNKIADSGKNGQFLKGLVGGGNISKKENWVASGNIINFGGEDVADAENAAFEGACIAGIVDITPFEEPAAE